MSLGPGDEADRRYRPEPDETALAREAVEDRAADHAPADLRSRQGSSLSPPPADGAPYQRPPSRGRAVIHPADSAPAGDFVGDRECVTHHGCDCLQRRNREALAVAGELRDKAGRAAEWGFVCVPPRTLRMLADRLDGGQS